MKITRKNCVEWLFLLVCMLIVLQTLEAEDVEEVVPLTFPEKAEAVGAVCLDGSPPAYQFQKGVLEGKDNWIIYMEGGAWCQNIEECSTRKSEHKGSSKHMLKNPEFSKDKDFRFDGILSVDSTLNPTEFRKWNKVVMRYCDGSSFTGDVEEPVENLFFRGKRIFDVIADELVNKQGLKDAKQVLLTGGSAGGLAAALHCDRFGVLLPSTVKFKCLFDGGYFIHATKDPKEAEGFESMFKDIISLHNSTGSLPQKCTAKMKEKPYLCMFPQYSVEDIVTPIFIMMSSYDAYQMSITLKKEYSDVDDVFKGHKRLGPNADYQALIDFRSQFFEALPKQKPSMGIFITNCFGHAELLNHWNTNGFQVNGVMDYSAVTNWFFDREKVNATENSLLIKRCDKNETLELF